VKIRVDCGIKPDLKKSYCLSKNRLGGRMILDILSKDLNN
jgi:hypothetical protein